MDTNGGSVVATAPASLVNGNCVVAYVTVYGGSSASDITPPTGWGTYVETAYAPSNTWEHGIYYKIIAGGDSFTFTTIADYTMVYIQQWSGTDTSTPLVDTPTTNSGNSATATGLAVTVGNNDSVLLWSMVGFTNGLSSGPAGMVERELNYDGTSSVFTLNVSAGSTGNKSGTMASSDEWSVTMGVLTAPLGGGGGGVAPPTGTRLATQSILADRSRLNAHSYRRSRGGVWAPAHVVH